MLMKGIATEGIPSWRGRAHTRTGRTVGTASRGAMSQAKAYGI